MVEKSRAEKSRTEYRKDRVQQRIEEKRKE